MKLLKINFAIVRVRLLLVALWCNSWLGKDLKILDLEFYLIGVVNMGKLLLNMYDEAMKIGKVNAQIRLAVLTKVPSKEAERIPDTPEMLNIFHKAIEKIKSEFQ